MTPTRPDLLSVTRILMVWGRVLVVLLMALGAVILIGLLQGGDKRLPSVTGSLASMSPADAMFALRAGVSGALVVGALLLLLIRELLRLIDSARMGDPFVPENGQRLRRAAWMLLAVNVCTNVTITIALTGGIKLPPVSFSAALTVLMVFVIARIFDTGTQMRAELKETI